MSERDSNSEPSKTQQAVATQLIPFGKYRGQPLAAIQHDRSYLEWLQGQGWFRERHAELYAIIINNFGETQDTPDHNRMQALFLDDSFCNKVMHAWFNLHVLGRYRKDIKYCPGYEISRTFEEDGIDVILRFMFWQKGTLFDGPRWDKNSHGIVHIELKPSIGDDYPGIIRQMSKIREARMVIYENYSGVGATEEDVRRMCQHSGIIMIRVDEIELYPNFSIRNVDEIKNLNDFL